MITAPVYFRLEEKGFKSLANTSVFSRANLRVAGH